MLKVRAKLWLRVTGQDWSCTSPAIGPQVEGQVGGSCSTQPHFPRVQALQHPDSLVTSVALRYLAALFLSWDFEVLLWYYHNHHRQTGEGFGAQQRFSLGFGHCHLPAWVLLPQSCLSVQQVSAVYFWDSLNMLLNYFCRLIEEATWAQALEQLSTNPLCVFWKPKVKSIITPCLSPLHTYCHDRAGSCQYGQCCLGCSVEVSVRGGYKRVKHKPHEKHFYRVSWD